MSLRTDADPIKLVPQAQRDIWTPSKPHRCAYEDGRGRCRNWARLYRIDGSSEARCEKHRPKETEVPA